jgi:hypothetical protein
MRSPIEDEVPPIVGFLEAKGRLECPCDVRGQPANRSQELDALPCVQWADGEQDGEGNWHAPAHQ